MSREKPLWEQVLEITVERDAWKAAAEALYTCLEDWRFAWEDFREADDDAADELLQHARNLEKKHEKP